MGMSVGSGGGPKSDINITPLVDVLLVLLIIFMVITPILQKGFATQVPQKAESVSNAPSTAIVLSIARDGSMSINRQPVSLQDLGEKLGAIYATRADKILFVDAEDKASYESVVKALDIARGPGKVETIGFVLN
jgi:biopolymer transport protein TolR